MEQLIYVLGGSFLRCHACSDRNLYFAGMSIPADTTKHDHGVAWAIFFLVAGVLTCLAIAYLVLHKFHRF